jgi:TetR/AcrR family transcriptional repressor of nem operon
MDGHIKSMPKPSNRDRILTEGLRVVHQRGYAGASVRDIVQAAGVPQGSFTNHFACKEAFGLEILELYFAAGKAVAFETLRCDALPPLARLRQWIDRNISRLNHDDMRDGCLFGNFAAEASGQSEAIRARLVGIFAEIAASIAHCLRAAAAAGEIAPGLDCDDMAAFIVASLQGANLLAKAQRSPAPVERFRTILFDRLLSAH